MRPRTLHLQLTVRAVLSLSSHLIFLHLVAQAIQQVAHGRVLSHGVANTTQPVQVLYTTAVPSTTPQVMYAIPNYYVQQQQSQPPHRG